MSCEISYEKFLDCADKISKEAEISGDSWQLKGDRAVLGGRYLENVSFHNADSDKRRFYKWEYHVCYSQSYSGPVMYFNVFDENGVLLTLSQVWECCPKEYKPNMSEEMYSMISQQEHPILLRPFFVVHPCKTWEFLEDLNENQNFLVKFITTVGPIVNLSINYRYAKI